MRFSRSTSLFARSCGLTAACASMLLASSGASLAQDDAAAPTTAAAATKVPEAKDVISSYVKALGGESAIRSHTSRKMTGKMEMPGMGGDPMIAPMVIYAAAPNKMMVEIEVPDFGEVRQGYDGEIAWSIDPMSGANILPPEQVEQMKEQTDFYGEINFDKRFKSMETIDARDFDGLKCYAVKMIDQHDEESTYFFEVETGLLRGTMQTTETQMGPMDMTNINKEYKEFGGVKFPVRTEIEMMGMTRVMTFSEIELDSVKAETFALPDEIKALVKSGETDGEKPAEGAGEKPEPKKEDK